MTDDDHFIVVNKIVCNTIDANICIMLVIGLEAFMFKLQPLTDSTKSANSKDNNSRAWSIWCVDHKLVSFSKTLMWSKMWLMTMIEHVSPPWKSPPPLKFRNIIYSGVEELALPLEEAGDSKIWPDDIKFLNSPPRRQFLLPTFFFLMKKNDVFF